MRSEATVFENPDLIREIASFLRPQLPLIMTCKLVKDSLRPLSLNQKFWIVSFKGDFANSIEMVEWAESMGCKFASEFFSPFHNDGNIDDYYSVTFYATRNNNLELLKWSRSQPSPSILGTYILNLAARNGNIEILEFLMTFKPCLSSTIINSAILGDNLETLKWLRSLNPPCPWGTEACAQAAALGKLDILQWLRAEDPPCPWSEDTVSRAVTYGRLEVLKWLRAEGCPFGTGLCEAASTSGHLAVLRWLRELDSPAGDWDRGRCLDVARVKRWVEVVQWIEDQEV